MCSLSVLRARFVFEPIVHEHSVSFEKQDRAQSTVGLSLTSLLLLSPLFCCTFIQISYEQFCWSLQM